MKNQGKNEHNRDFAPTLRQGSKEEERKGSPRRDTKTIGIYFAPALPSRIQNREKRNVSPRRETKQEGFILPLPCSKDSKKEKTKWLLWADEPKQEGFISPLPCPQGFKKGGNEMAFWEENQKTTAVHNLSLHQKDKTRRGNKKNLSPILLTLREGSRKRNCNRS